MIGSRSPAGRKNLHFASRPQRRLPVRAVAVAVALLVVLVLVLLLLAAVETPPAIRLQRVLPAAAVVPGSAPAPAWPAQGEAAVEVQGLPPLGSSGGETPVPIASVAKVMTAWVVLQDSPLGAGQAGFTATIGAPDVADYHARLASAQSVVSVAVGETITEQQLLEGLIIASGNNLAVVLADHDAGSVPAFVAKMNSAAHQLGMLNTTYTDPSGLESMTVSTATDQLKLADRIMALPAFAQIAGMPTATLPDAGILPNFDKQIGTAGYVGIKTGSDSAAGGCLLFANRATVDGHTVTIIGAVLGQQAGHTSTSVLLAAANTAANNLVQSVTAALAERIVVPAGTEVAVAVDAQGHRVAIRTGAAITEFGVGGTRVPLTVTLQGPGRRLVEGQVVGAVAPAGDETVRAPASAQATMPSVTYFWRLRHAL